MILQAFTGILFSGYIVGFGMTGLAYFVGFIYALSFAQIMLAEMAAREAASFVMMVVSALDGDSSSVVQYEIMLILYSKAVAVKVIIHIRTINSKVFLHCRITKAHIRVYNSNVRLQSCVKK